VKRVTADSNIYVSALQFGGKPLLFLHLARAREIDLAISDAILAETSRVLRTKFEWSQERFNEAEAFVCAITTHVTPTETLDVVSQDQTDNRILECAVVAEADVIVSGDTHLLSIGSFRGIRIQRVAEFLGSLEDRG
jgi:putative PIN family toxin of toxin-antitoxin system